MPPAPALASTVVAATSKLAWTRPFLASHQISTLPNAIAMTAAKPAFLPPASPGRNSIAGRFNVLRRHFSFGSATRRPRAPSCSSVPSVLSSASSLSDDGSEGPSSHSSVRNFTATPVVGGRSKLSSSRAQAAVALLPSYLLDARAVTQYSPSTPDGALQLSVAENQLCELPVEGLVGIMEDTKAGGVGTLAQGNAAKEGMRLVDVLSQIAASTVARPSDDAARAVHVFATDMVYYQPTQGVPGVRAAVAHYLQRLLNTPAAFNPDHLVLGAGCNAVLENLCTTLCDVGDAVLIPTPYYAAFEFDLAARAGCQIVPVTTMDHQRTAPPACGTPIPAEYYYPTRASLDAAYDRAAGATGRPPRVLLLSHPNNPLGVCYPPEVVGECIDWCREREVHLVSDEIYAGSVHSPTGGDEPTFVSAMALGSQTRGGDASDGLGLGPYVHLVYALSKDFALSGLRVGAVYTENDEILLPLQKLNDLCQISSQTQLLVERMMTANAVVREEDGGNDASQKFTDVYLKANAENIRARCERWQATLSELGIPYLDATAGLFVWMDFREFLPALPAGTTEAEESLESRERRERTLYLYLMKEYGLLFTPGMSMRNERAGFFRCVFTAASGDEFELGLERLTKFVRESRQG